MKNGEITKFGMCFLFISFILIGHCMAFGAELPDSANTGKESYPSTIADNFIIDADWICIDLGRFEPHAINNSTEIAGDIIADKIGSFAGVWKQGFAEKLDGKLVTRRSSAVAINDKGEVVGYQQGRYGDLWERAVLWDKGTIQELGTLAGIESRALAINQSGDVVGWVKTSYGATDAFIWRSGTMEYLGLLTSANAINSDGQILGITDGGFSVLWNKDLIQNLEPPGEQEFTPVGAILELKKKPADHNNSDKSKPVKTRLIPTCLNDNGLVAGYYESGAFLWNKGELQFIESNRTDRIIPRGINKYGMLSGRINNKAVVWNNGKVTDLNSFFKKLRGWSVTEARGINDYGQIIVYATNGRREESRGFLLTPKTKVPILFTGNDYTEMELGRSESAKELMERLSKQDKARRRDQPLKMEK